MWRLDDYWIIKREDLSEEHVPFIESPNFILPRISQWISEGGLNQLIWDLNLARASDGVIRQSIVDALERQELFVLSPVPLSSTQSGKKLWFSAATNSVKAAFVLGQLVFTAEARAASALPEAPSGQDLGGSDARDDWENDAPISPAPISPAPTPTATEPEPDKENWIFIEHLRPCPGDLDPEMRKPTGLQPVLSTAHVYEAGTQNEVATAKVGEDGNPTKVMVPVHLSDFDVVYDDDFGGEYEIAHEPYANPFTDKTPEPTDAQRAQLVNFRFV